jgi:putative sigma-54 modulation protein
MQVNITARHLELTNALADYVRKKVEKCERYFDQLVWAQVILSVEKYRQVAEIVIHGSKITFRAKEESIDLYAAFDLAIDKMEKQLRKHKEKAKIHRKMPKMTPAAARKAAQAAEKVLASAALESATHVITEVRRFDVKPVSIQDAINEMNIMGYTFYMFLNSGTSHINVVYRRDNGSYGLLEPEM